MFRLSAFVFVVMLFMGCDIVDFSVDEKTIFAHELKTSLAIEGLDEAMDKYKRRRETALNNFEQVEQKRKQMESQMDKINAISEHFDSTKIQKEHKDLITNIFDSIDKVENIFRKIGEQGDLLNAQEKEMNEEYLMLFLDAGHRLGQKQKLTNMKVYIKSLDEAVKNIDDFILKIQNDKIHEIEKFEKISSEAEVIIDEHISICDNLLQRITQTN
ncbi:hypothetical protein [Helicobacter sp. T3_23-1056]